MLILVLLALISSAGALCTDTCESKCTLYCSGCNEVALCKTAVDAAHQLHNITEATDLIGFCDTVIRENIYINHTYHVSCLTASCDSGATTTCEANCQICRDGVICDLLIDKINNIVNKTTTLHTRKLVENTSRDIRSRCVYEHNGASRISTWMLVPLLILVML